MTTAGGDDRDRLGRLVRDTWVEWAKQQPVPKQSWLVGWDELDERQRDVDRRIGQAVCDDVLASVRTKADDVRASLRAYAAAQKSAYVDMLMAKARAADGAVQQALLDRIERLLGIGADPPNGPAGTQEEVAG